MEQNTLTRADIVDVITTKFYMTKGEALEFVEDILDEVASTLVSGETVKITGFGTFSVKDKKERIGRNPKTKEEAVICARKTISFKPSNMLKKKINRE